MFCTNLFAGLILGQVCAETMPADVYSTWKHVVKIVTMFHLSYIMINVGFEFELDKTKLSSYAVDYLVAMTAAEDLRRLFETQRGCARVPGASSFPR